MNILLVNDADPGRRPISYEQSYDHLDFPFIIRLPSSKTCQDADQRHMLFNEPSNPQLCLLSPRKIFNGYIDIAYKYIHRNLRSNFVYHDEKYTIFVLSSIRSFRRLSNVSNLRFQLESIKSIIRIVMSDKM